MDFNITHEGSEIKIIKSMFSGRMKVFNNGAEVEKNKGKGKIYKLNDNTTLELKNNGIDFIVPKALINGNEILLARKLAKYEIILAFLPLPLVAIGGALGGGLAGAGCAINMYILRSSDNKAGNIIKVLLNTILMFVVYFIIASFLLKAIN